MARQGLRVFLIDAEGGWTLLSDEPTGLSQAVPPQVPSIPSGDLEDVTFYENTLGQAVMGAYRQLPEWQLAVWVEQSQDVLRAEEDGLAAMLLGSTLAVALLTAVLAAAITRQLTRPIVDLTVSAVKIAGGDLSQSVDLDRRDEIGILARAFNIMTAELRSLYTGLEQKVRERTWQVTEANQELRYKAMQLKLSAEVGRVATSILDLDLLLRRVTELILETYAHVHDVSYVAVFLQDELSGRLERRASSGHGGEHEVFQTPVGDESLIGQTVHDGSLGSHQLEAGFVHVSIPLRIGARVIGRLDLHCSRHDALDTDDVEILQGLGDQISVAIENARLYAIERDTVERLSRLDDLRLASLSVGSRELATELNTIIGFSRLMLKEADGSLTELQRTDLAAIYRSGYKLLGLIDNVVTLSELEGSSRQLVQQSVDLAALLHEVLDTARQRLVDATFEWQDDGALPHIWGDPALLRQAFLGLVTTAADQFDHRGLVVCTRVNACETKQVVVSLGSGHDLGPVGRVVDPDLGLDGRDARDVRVELALARRIIALHQGSMMFQVDAEDGVRCVVELPLRVVHS
jgi:signal transduction histidine kinase